LEKPFPAYSGDEPYIFVCYSHDDIGVVYPEIGWLQERGINLWYDEGISAGRVWRAEIAQAIDACSIVLYYVSKSSLDSAHCNREINLALDQDKTILPVYLEDVELTDDLRVGLSRVQALNRAQDANYQQQLLYALGQSPAVEQTPVVSKKNRSWTGLAVTNRTSVWWAAGVLGAIVAGGSGYWLMNGGPAGSEPFERSIAVLPFATTGTDPALGSYASGLTQELRGRISGYQELQSIIASSNASPDSVSPNPVAYVVEGGIQRIGDDRRVRVQLIRSADRQVVWSERYDETETDNADPAMMASTMGRYIRLQLVQDQECQAVKRKSHSMEAAELVCAAQAQTNRINQRGAVDPQLMRANAERAVSLDPDLLEAYQVLPTAYLVLAIYGQLSVEEASRLAHIALERALAIERDDAYTLNQLGLVESNLDLDYDSAESNFRKAIANDPLHPNARYFHDQRGRLENRRGNLAAALEHYRRAIRIFDSDGLILAEYAKALYFSGLYREAIEAADVARTLSPSGLQVWYLSRSKFYAQRSLGDETQAEATLVEYLSSAEPAWKPFAAGMLATSGKTDEARRSMALIESRPRPSTYPLSLAYVELGEHDQAFEWLQRGIEGYDPVLLNWIRVDPAFDALREDPRWEEVMDQLERQEAKGRARNQKYASP
jgi:TolB-like protein/tetratricopeptide (TPR) repeat protein